MATNNVCQALRRSILKKYLGEDHCDVLVHVLQIPNKEYSPSKCATCGKYEEDATKDERIILFTDAAKGLRQGRRREDSSKLKKTRRRRNLPGRNVKRGQAGITGARRAQG